MRTVERISAAVASGLAINGAFPDLGWWPLAMVGIGLLWWTLDGVRAWAAFGLGWIAGVAFFAPHVWWAFVSVGAVPWIALTMVQALAFGLAGAAWAHVTRAGFLDKHVWLDAPVFAAIWVGVEQVRAMVPFGGFPWGRLAFSQVDGPLAPLATLVGAPGVSWATAAVGVWLALALAAGRERRWLEAALSPAAVVVVIAGATTISLPSSQAPEQLWVGAVQGNVPNAGLDAFAQARLVTTNHFQQTMVMLDGEAEPLDLLVWPENSVDFDPRTDAASMEMVTAAASAAGVPILIGTVDYSPPDARYNASLLMSETGVVLDMYYKQRPAPFAEYIPMRDLARRFSEAVDRVRRDMIAGTQPGLIHVPVSRLDRDVPVGVVICFEIAYDSIVMDSVREGAQVLMVQTNNANFGLTAESTQQLAMSRFRAIETGRATVQISTVGVSAMIRPDGSVMRQTELFTADHLYAPLPLRDQLTVAVRAATLIQWASLLLPLGLVGWAAYRRIARAYTWD